MTDLAEATADPALERVVTLDPPPLSSQDLSTAGPHLQQQLFRGNDLQPLQQPSHAQQLQQLQLQHQQQLQQQHLPHLPTAMQRSGTVAYSSSSGGGQPPLMAAGGGAVGGGAVNSTSVGAGCVVVSSGCAILPPQQQLQLNDTATSQQHQHQLHYQQLNEAAAQLALYQQQHFNPGLQQQYQLRPFQQLHQIHVHPQSSPPPPSLLQHQQLFAPQGLLMSSASSFPQKEGEALSFLPPELLHSDDAETLEVCKPILLDALEASKPALFDVSGTNRPALTDAAEGNNPSLEAVGNSTTVSCDVVNVTVSSASPIAVGNACANSTSAVAADVVESAPPANTSISSAGAAVKGTNVETEVSAQLMMELVSI